MVLVMVLAVLTPIPRTKNHQRVGLNMTLILKLTLEEIHNGVTKKFKYKRNDTCKTCHGHMLWTLQIVRYVMVMVL
jgi:DnaJ-class molecular chaperone